MNFSTASINSKHREQPGIGAPARQSGQEWLPGALFVEDAEDIRRRWQVHDVEGGTKERSEHGVGKVICLR